MWEAWTSDCHELYAGNLSSGENSKVIKKTEMTPAPSPCDESKTHLLKEAMQCGWVLLIILICYINILKQNCTFCSSFVNYLISCFFFSYFWGTRGKKEKKKGLSLAFDHILRSSVQCSLLRCVDGPVAISLLLSHIAFTLRCLSEEDVVMQLKASKWTVSKTCFYGSPQWTNQTKTYI